MRQFLTWSGRRWQRWFGERPAARSVALFSGLNLFMITLYAMLVSSVVVQRGLSGLTALLALAAVPTLAALVALALYGGILYFLRPGARSKLELGLLGVLGGVVIALCTFYLNMPFLGLALVPLVARYWLSLRKTLVVGVGLIAWSALWYAFFSPQAMGAALIVAIMISFFSLLFGGYTLLSFEFAMQQARAREELDRLYGQLEQSYRQLRGYRELEIQHAYLEERSRMSRELHDTLGHQLTAQRFDLQVLKKLVSEPKPAEAVGRALDRNAEAMSDLRHAVQALRPERLERLGLAGSLRQLVGLLADPSLVCLEITGEEGALRPELALALYRIGQEALTNAAKHAPGKRLELRLEFASDCVELTATNDMSGEADKKTGFGLAGLRERAEALGGQFAAGHHHERFELWARLPR